MRPRKASAVVLGAFFVALTAACADGSGSDQEDSGFSQVCEDFAGFRVDDSECEDDDDGDGGGHYRHRYYPSSTHVPPVGSRMPAGGLSSRPGGHVGSFPKTGGFGSHGGTTGS